MRQGGRASALIAAIATAIAASGLGVAEPAQHASEPASAKSHSHDRPRPLGHSVWELEGPRLRREQIVADGAFPVAGPHEWGTGEAEFGSDRGGRKHEGHDLFASPGTRLVAALDGTVVQTGDDGGRGNYVAIFNEELGETYTYLHMQEPTRLRPGGAVAAGDPIGSVGCTGSCWGDHLHLERRAGRGPDGPVLDPRPVLQQLR